MPSPSEVAVIVCTRDRESFLDNALTSIRAVTPPEVDILVVDSASLSRATSDVARSHGVRYLRLDRGGLSIARNAGLRAVSRPYVVFTDDDCVATPGWTTHITAHFVDGAVDAVGGLMLDEGEASPPATNSWRTHDPLTAMDAGHGALMAFRRQVPLLLGGFDEILGAGRTFAGAEDLDMFFRVARSGGVVVHDSASVVRHAHVREGAAYSRLMRGYGLGVGAFLAKWLRTDSRRGRAALWRVTRRSFTRSLRSLRHVRTRTGEQAFQAGVIAGLRAAWKIPVVGETFVDRRAPVYRAAAHPRVMIANARSEETA